MGNEAEDQNSAEQVGMVLGRGSEQIGHRIMTAGDGKIVRGFALVVNSGGIGPVRQEKLDEVHIAIHRRRVDWGPPALLPDIRVRTVGQQQTGECEGGFRSPTRDCRVEGGDPHRVL